MYAKIIFTWIIISQKSAAIASKYQKVAAIMQHEEPNVGIIAKIYNAQSNELDSVNKIIHSHTAYYAYCLDRIYTVLVTRFYLNTSW